MLCHIFVSAKLIEPKTVNFVTAKRMKLRYIFNFLVICVVVISCNSYDLPNGTPECIKEKIIYFSDNHVCDSIRVEQYSYQGRRYYSFVEPCCCDIGSNWYNEFCEVVCTTGTIGGTINCTIDIDSLVFEEVIWQE
ncbi:MAG: DUF6970 domain-containing protein [Chitinophagales bacterium]